jgi:hypothetical protein
MKIIVLLLYDLTRLKKKGPVPIQLDQVFGGMHVICMNNLRLRDECVREWELQ